MGDASGAHARPVGTLLPSFGRDLNVAVVGASGGIGAALTQALVADPAVSRVFAMARDQVGEPHAKVCPARLELEEPASIAAAGATVRDGVGASLHLVVVASGLLHDGAGMQPEKSWQALDGARLERSFRGNAMGPALLARDLLPLLARDRKSAFAAISARVGGIEDNRLGRWYGYRASKAALNMLVRTLAPGDRRLGPIDACSPLRPVVAPARGSRYNATSKYLAGARGSGAMQRGRGASRSARRARPGAPSPHGGGPCPGFQSTR
ncbi:MAG: SDR family NAD(P)-dependent oxidoreductase [Burkholderiales bacterium]|nr:MAG: SDR family NAD(P)-dependent oxidoreductase [Burkholderiales bacterium]